MFNVQGTELILLGLLALIILGPSRLPEYAARLAHLVRQARDLAEGAKTQIREEMGPAFEDVDWRQLDPRQYDPRRIVREALSAPSGPPLKAAGPADPLEAGQGEEPSGPRRLPGGRPVVFDPALPVPFDLDAT